MFRHGQRPEQCRDIGCRSECGWHTAATLVTAGALVAVADKRVDAVERDAVVHYIKERMRAPGLTGPPLATCSTNVRAVFRSKIF
jgi:hypothetical protein